MVQVTHYKAYFTPNGIGYLIFHLNGEAHPRQTANLSAADMAALLSLVTLGNVTYDPAMNLFASNH